MNEDDYDKTKTFFPFEVVFVRQGKNWMGRDDGWMDGQAQEIEKTNDGWVRVDWSVYDVYAQPEPQKTRSPCESHDRLAYPIEPYTARYVKRNGQLYCPNGHLANDGYFIGCLGPRSRLQCPFDYRRQYHYKKCIHDHTGEAIEMRIEIVEE